MSRVSERDYLMSYQYMRRAVGLLGVFFPFILWIGAGLRKEGWQTAETISHYYCSPMRDVFVGVLFTIGLFLYAYKGPRGSKSHENRAGNLACICALVVAMFPTCDGPMWVKFVHGSAAGCLFLLLSAFCFFFFPEHVSPAPPKQAWRNRYYRTCGLVIVSSMALFVVVALSKPALPWAWQPKWLLETIALVAFGASWLLKGEYMFFLSYKDEDMARAKDRAVSEVIETPEDAP